MPLLPAPLQGVSICCRSRHTLIAENLLLRQQLIVYQRKQKQPVIKDRDRRLWILIARLCSDWKDALLIVQPETVLRWHRRGWRHYWRWKSTAKPVLHGDNGATLKATTVLAMLHWPGINPSYSRPRVSDDNAYAESLFRTAKYRPEFPAQGFASLEAARAWAAAFVHWYNVEHRHSGIRYVTPAQRHAGEKTTPCRQPVMRST